MDVYQRIEELGISLPEPPAPVGTYVPLKVSGRLVFLSGILPFKDGDLMARGKVPAEVGVDTARQCARQCIINALALVEREVGLRSVGGIVRLNGYVASSEGFFDQPGVLNAASELLFQVFGERGRHTRVAIGVPVLPLNAPLEIDLICELI